MTVMVMDIETIPNTDLLPNAKYAMPPPTAADAPKNYGEEAAQKWADKKILEYDEKVRKTMGTDPILGRAICIGTILYDPITESRDVTVYGCDPDTHTDLNVCEASILEQYWTALSGCDQLLTFNGRNFDVPFLQTRSNMLSVTQHDFEEEGHIDLMRFTSTRAYTGGFNNKSLDELRAWFGLGRDTDHTGADVFNDWEAGDIESIHTHCIDDINATLDLALKLGAI